MGINNDGKGIGTVNPYNHRLKRYKYDELITKSKEEIINILHTQYRWNTRLKNMFVEISLEVDFLKRKENMRKDGK